MINRPYVDWKSIDEAKGNAISGKVYLVVENMDKMEDDVKVANYMFATWYDAGETVSIDKMTVENKGKTVEEKMITTIFGEQFEYVIPESGFYREVYGICDLRYWDEDVFTENKCEYGVYPLENIEYWSGLPITPEGFITWEEANDIENINMEARRRKRHDEEIEKITEKFMSDTLLNGAFGHICKKGISKDIPYDFTHLHSGYGVDFHTNTYDMAHSILCARDFYNVLKYMTDNNISFKDIDEVIETGDSDEIYKVLDDIKMKTGVETAGFMKKVAHIFFNHRYRDDYYARRSIFARKYKNRKENIVKILTKSEIERSLLWKVHRVSHLLGFGSEKGSEVPEIIMINEFRMMAEQFVLYDCVDSIDNVTWEFKERQGVNEDGTEYDGSETPKLKNKVKIEDEGEDGLWEVEVINPDGSTGKIKLSMGQLNLIKGWNTEDGEESEYFDYGDELEDEEGVIGVDYPYFAVVVPPNYLMFDTKFVIFDNIKHDYVRDDNNKVKTFNDWKDAMELKVTLDEEAEEREENK